jgi:hypothetical protein
MTVVTRNVPEFTGTGAAILKPMERCRTPLETTGGPYTAEVVTGTVTPHYQRTR